MQANMTMADNKNNRKSKRNFSLEKPIERRFDIEKDEAVKILKKYLREKSDDDDDDEEDEEDDIVEDDDYSDGNREN